MLIEYFSINNECCNSDNHKTTKLKTLGICKIVTNNKIITDRYDNNCIKVLIIMFLNILGPRVPKTFYIQLG